MLASMEGKVLQRMSQVASAAVGGLWRASAPRAARDRARSWTCLRACGAHLSITTLEALKYGEGRARVVACGVVYLLVWLT